jgi:hypothetical protein
VFPGLRTLTVLPVGNGACSVVRDSPWQGAACDSVTVIDCGSRRSPHGRPGIMLGDELSVADRRDLSSVVVTHFDGDHWRGLRTFAKEILRRGDRLGVNPLPMYSPAVPFGIPPKAPAGSMALLSATAGHAVEAVDLAAEWNAVVPTELVPSAAGDTIEIAGRSLEVVWPPRAFGGPLTGEAASIVEAIERLAERLRTQNYPELSSALHNAYQHRTFTPRAFRQEAPGTPHGLVEGDFSLADDIEVDVAVDVDDEPVEDRRPIPKELLDAEDRRLVRQARKLQNFLSLVFHDPYTGSLLVYGDVPEQVVAHLNAELCPSYTAVLAPHHGTHAMPPGAPEGFWCVAQGGAGEYHALWRGKHRRTHTLGDCLHLSAGGGRPLRMVL